MGQKRGASGLNLVVGVDKPTGLSSHDVVNRCRRIFGERRVGHTGTLDPLATGALLVCVGPSARLDAFFSSDEKTYRVRMALGASTDTDDAQGSVTGRAPVPEAALDPVFAQRVLDEFKGFQSQLPPVYSALKVGGKKSCDQARKGHVIELAPRTVTVGQARLLRIADGAGEVRYQVDAPDDLTPWAPATEEEPTYAGLPTWDVEFQVSKGTYIRSLARDIGLHIGCGAHVTALRRTRAGRLTLADCVSLETLEELGVEAALDPVRLLGGRFAYLDDALWAKVANGNPLPAAGLQLCTRQFPGIDAALCACTSGVTPSCEPPHADEVVALIYRNRVVALYGYDAERGRYCSRCGLGEGVSRGEGV